MKRSLRLHHINYRSIELKVLLVLTISAATTFLNIHLAWAQEQPNIIIMMTDDQGYGDVSFHGNPYVQTPHLAAMAREGVEMTHFYTYPNCSPTRAGLLTGRYPCRTGVVSVTQVDHLMNASERTIAEILGDHGYRTGIFGKWHLGDNYPMRPTDQGFQEALVHKAGGIGQAAGPPGNTYFDPVLEHNNVSKRFEGYCDDIFTDAALAFMEASDQRPFFCYLATNLPHFPLVAPDQKADPYRQKGLHEANALTYGMIENIDSNVGRVMQKLDELGISENTLVIFTSDNGPRHRRTKNDVYPGRWVANLRGTKTSVYECGIRVPFIARWPGKLNPGIKMSVQGSMLDILPTVLEISKIELREDLALDGQSLWPLWTKGVMPDGNKREFIVQVHYGATVFKYMHFAVRSHKYKLVSPHDDPHNIKYQPTEQELTQVLAKLELYDIENDPSERKNLAREKPEVVEKLLAKYEDWYDEVTQERDAKGIQRIYLGTTHQPKVILSRFDWGGPRVIAKNTLGYWRVHTEKGNYQVRLDLPKLHANGVAHIKYQDLHLSQSVRADQTAVVFEDVRLPEGEGNFQAFLKVDRLPSGPRFVEVERIGL